MIEKYVWLSNLKISNQTKFKLLKKFKGIDNLYNSSLDDLVGANLNDNLIFKILNKETKIKAKKDINYMNKHNIDIVYYNDKYYPEKLKNINDKPVCFYIKGNKNILDKESVGIVGSRNAFKSSLDFTKEISKRISSKRNKYNKWFGKRS